MAKTIKGFGDTSAGNTTMALGKDYMYQVRRLRTSLEQYVE